ncbi:hypothetical protein BDP81DRAFT_425307 [Colletotrichum phormii]|uniref:Uncharacterized protein n=1 Tax=Colletotrichum phormii TaxID=359342 RepID=A0AAI9ZSR7_9PEZI|nr:uncharacterized protein BDP81DRAFT_425307 [Colletotrichum phormii]KAK1637486.1 hypothetical protein BDP81DRAFT_425307 [Colletotrichum phormii]
MVGTGNCRNDGLAFQVPVELYGAEVEETNSMGGRKGYCVITLAPKTPDRENEHRSSPILQTSG